MISNHRLQIPDLGSFYNNHPKVNSKNTVYPNFRAPILYLNAVNFLTNLYNSIKMSSYKSFRILLNYEK